MQVKTFRVSYRIAYAEDYVIEATDRDDAIRQVERRAHEAFREKLETVTIVGAAELVEKEASHG